MITLNKVTEMVKALGNDAKIEIHTAEEDFAMVYVTLQDLAGFGKNLRKKVREFDNEQAIDDFMDTLEQECLTVEGDYNICYWFPNFLVTIDHEFDNY
jgi:hypothetical protein